MNDNKIRVFNSTDGSILSDPDDLLGRVEQIRFSTGYPGGIFDGASFFIPCDPTRYSPLRHTQMVQIKNGLVTVWEGFITSITLVVNVGVMGFDVQATGYWGVAFKRYKYNRWIDRRFTAGIFGVWEPTISELGSGAKTTFDQSNQLLISPSAYTQWSTTDHADITYSTNGGNKVKRIVFDYELSTQVVLNPERAKKYITLTSQYTSNYDAVVDGTPTTTLNMTMSPGDYFYIAVSEAYNIGGIRFAFGATTNNTASVMTLEYYDVDGTWKSLSITDGTDDAGATLHSDGDVTFTPIDTWGKVSVNGGTEFYYVRFSVSVIIQTTILEDIYILRNQSWKMSLYDNDNTAELWSTSTAGTGSQDIALATTSDSLTFKMTSLAPQYITGDGVYSKVTALAVLCENSAGISGSTVNYLMKALVHYLGDPFLDDYTYIAANTYDLLTTGFVADDYQKPIAQQMIDIGRASATDVAYSVGVLESEAIGGTNYKPVIYYEQVPLLTDYDYALRLDEDNISGVDLVLSSDLDELYNSVISVYTDDNGKEDWGSVSDYAGLDDATSQTKYLKRTLPVNVGSASTAALAGPLGAVYLTNKKNLSYFMRGALQIRGTIRKKDGSRVAVSMVRAGKRIRIENFSADIGDVIGAGLTFLISRTEYDDDSGVMSITTGISDDLAQYLAWLDATRKAS